MRDAVVSLARDRGLAMVAENGHLSGVLTTGDLTRLAERDPVFLERPVSEVMTRSAKTAAQATWRRRGGSNGTIQDYRASGGRDQGAIVGVVHLHDLMRAGAV